MALAIALGADHVAVRLAVGSAVERAMWGKALVRATEIADDRAENAAIVQSNKIVEAING